MKTNFKKGDRVFDIRYGWGVVEEEVQTSVCVKFDSCEMDRNHYWGTLLRVLSFTEYTLEGFSQERPEKLPNIGDIVWGKNIDDDFWHIGHFYEIDIYSKTLKYCISSNPSGIKKLWVQQITTSNPYENEQ